MKLVNGVLTPLSPEDVAADARDEARRPAKEAAAEAQRVAREAALAETPESVTSVPELRDKVNEILKLLRGEL